MADTQNRLNPLVVVAAASIVVFSAVGVGVMTGIIPSSFSKSAENSTAEAKKAAAAEAPKKAAVREAAREPTKPARVAAPEPVKPAVCADCGRIEAINVVEQKGEGTGLGAVAGGVVGGVLGNQVGRGSGRKIATVAGVAGGAYAGHQIEKHAKATKRYDVTVRMDDGVLRSVSYDAEPSFRVGDKVKIINGMLVSS
jgi:outer membrane lipoprotein SlyB